MSKQAKPPPPGDKPKPSAPPPPPAWRNWLWPIMIVVIFALFYLLPHGTPSTSLTYTQFLSDVNAGQVKTVQLASTSGSTSTGTLTNGKSFTVVVPPQAGQVLLTDLQQHNVQISSAPSGNGFGTSVLIFLITFGLPIVFFIWLFRRISSSAAGGLQGIMGVGRSRAKVFDEERPTTTFCRRGRLRGREIRDRRGRRLPPASRTGIPGPARWCPAASSWSGRPAPARRCWPARWPARREVPFFSVTGSSFVELFVGVGASRVRDLFAEARKRAPAIIFIDEVDAIGQRRAGGQGAYVANDEREQTLNQLLAELDGFEPTAGIVVLAATNRPEILDPALLRPGRFDRQVTIPLPNVNERAAILAVHCRGKKLAPDVDLSAIARGTPGFSGADLANLVNEAAIFAVRDGRDVITAGDFDAARDRIILGRREGSNVLLPEEKHAVAVHESGHALVAALSEHADPVAKVTILPAGQTLGVTEQLPLVERHMYGEDYLHDSLAVRLGGRAAELVVLGQGSTGAANDLAGATDLATKMVREFGLSETLGPIGYPEGGSVFLGGGGPPCPAARSPRPPRRKSTARSPGCCARPSSARSQLLKAHRPELDSLVSLLLEMETVDGRRCTGWPASPTARPPSPPVPPTTTVGRPGRWRPPTPVPRARRGPVGLAVPTNQAERITVPAPAPVRAWARVPRHRG